MNASVLPLSLRRARVPARLLAIVGLSSLLSACPNFFDRAVGNPKPAAAALPSGYVPAAVSTSGSFTLQQFDRDAKPAALISRSSRYTLMPEGSAP